MLWRSARDRRYRRRLPERFGALPTLFQRTVRDSIWLHAVSVGEVLSAVELIRRIRAALPDAPVFVSCGTVAGREAADSRLSAVADGIFYAPFDLVFAVRRVMRRIRPAAVVVLETEIWPNLYAETKRAGCALVVVNGRISDKSLPSYRRHSWFFRAPLSLPDAILVQSEQDRERYLIAGAPESVVHNAGNLKYDFNPRSSEPPAPVREWLDRGQGPLWIAASTVAPEFPGDVDEDDAVIAAWNREVRLLIAPRKPERFDVVASKLEAEGITFARRSTLPRNIEAPVLLLDSVGELASLFAHADVVFMGGTLAHRGGHNILEPAAAGKPIVVGPHLENFAAIQQRFRAGQGMLEIQSAMELQDAIGRLMRDGVELGARARALADAERGATDRAVRTIVEQRWRAVPRNVPAIPLRMLSSAWTVGGALKRAATSPRRLSKPVVSVGGLAMGGSGKTPVVRALARALRDSGMQPAVLTRGYKRVSGELTVVRAGDEAPIEATGDEAQTILRDGCAHLGIGADRYKAGLAVEQQLRPDVFLLDDGFQHARLHRDLDIVVLDGLDPFAGGWTFPAGRLREPLSALARADVIALSRAEGRCFDGVLERIRTVNRDAPIVHVETRPVCWVETTTGARFPLDAFQSRECVAFCGLGNPEAFRRTLSSLGYKPSLFRVFPDHHAYSASDLVELSAPVMLTTEKDAVKLIGRQSVYYLAIEADVQYLMNCVHRFFTQQ